MLSDMTANLFSTVTVTNEIAQQALPYLTTRGRPNNFTCCVRKLDCYSPCPTVTWSKPKNQSYIAAFSTNCTEHATANQLHCIDYHVTVRP